MVAFVGGGFGIGYICGQYFTQRKYEEQSNKPKRRRWKQNPNEPWAQDPDWWKR